jgi:shikimate dehydrogenase
MSRISGKTKILGIIGSPVTHSLSPAMHNAALAAMNMDYIYIPLPVDVKDLATAVSGLKAISAIKGFNLTIPHKQEIIPFLDQISDTARSVGAVNTVKRVGEEWVGTNTDVAGFLAPLIELNRDWQQTPAVVLGSGGAARAVIAGCLQLGCPVVHVVGRDFKKMKKFHGQLTTQLQNYAVRVHTWSSLSNLLEVAGLVVNATPIGMGDDPNTPVSQEQVEIMPENAIAYDLIYTPAPTKFLKLAKARDLMAIDGLEMLLNQGAIALEFWLGRPAPIEVMHQALLDNLGC